jgi:hypothetical protein
MTSLRSHRKWITRTTRRAVTIYQVTDRLGDGRTVRVSGHEIAATVSAWLAELGTVVRWSKTLPKLLAPAIGPQPTPLVSTYQSM